MIGYIIWLTIASAPCLSYITVTTIPPVTDCETVFGTRHLHYLDANSMTEGGTVLDGEIIRQ